MFFIAKKDLIKFIEESYDSGRSGPADLSENVTQNLLTRASTKEFRFKTCTIVEIQKMAGKKIIHPLLGEGEVYVHNNHFFVAFGERVEGLDHDNPIWSYPIAVNFVAKNRS